MLPGTTTGTQSRSAGRTVGDCHCQPRRRRPTDVPPRVSSLRTPTDFSILAASRQEGGRHGGSDGGFDREGGGEHPGRDTPVRARRQANRGVCATAAAGTRDAALPGRSAPRAYREAMADRGRGVIEAKQSTGRRRTLDTSYHRCEGGLRRTNPSRLCNIEHKYRRLAYPGELGQSHPHRAPRPGWTRAETRHAPRLELAPQAQRTPVLRAKRRGRFGCRG